jgi:hypothetical protein
VPRAQGGGERERRPGATRDLLRHEGGGVEGRDVK